LVKRFTFGVVFEALFSSSSSFPDDDEFCCRSGSSTAQNVIDVRRPRRRFPSLVVFPSEMVVEVFALALVPPPPPRTASTTTPFFLRGQDASSCRRLDDDVDDIIHERFFSLRIATSDVNDWPQKEEDIIFLLYRSLLDDLEAAKRFSLVVVVVFRCSSMRDDAVQSDKREREIICVTFWMRTLPRFLSAKKRRDASIRRRRLNTLHDAL